MTKAKSTQENDDATGPRILQAFHFMIFFHIARYLYRYAELTCARLWPDIQRTSARNKKQDIDLSSSAWTKLSRVPLSRLLFLSPRYSFPIKRITLLRSFLEKIRISAEETSRSDGICHWDKPATRFTSGLIIFGARAAPSLSRLFLHFLA